MKEHKIKVDGLISFDNRYFLNRLIEYNNNGIPYPLKNCDALIEELIKVIKLYCRYGEECCEEIIELSIRKKDIKYLAVFIKSVKSLHFAERILWYIFEESNMFERNASFFYVLAEVTRLFPDINITRYFNTLSQ
jgi:hypothetical protein